MEITLFYLVVFLCMATLDALLRHFCPFVTFENGVPRRRLKSEGRRVRRMTVPRLLYHYRNVIVALPLVHAAFSFSYEAEVDWLTWPLGTFLVLSGVALRIWAQQHIRLRLGVPRRLATTGPYSIVRNPLYIANALICIGATVLSELLWMVPITFVWCLAVYSLVVRQEEARLLRKYGEQYRRYAAAVPRWIPRRLGLSDLGMTCGHLRAAFMVEAPCLLIMVPYLVKELVLPWLGH